MQKRKMIYIASRSLFVGLAILLTVCSLTSCNTCDNPSGGSGGGIENRVYFTAFPLNSLVPSIYSINAQGRDIKLHASNGTLFSAPSHDGKIAFLRFDAARAKNVIMLSRIDRADSMRIDEDNPDYSVAQPILSPDGRKIAFNGGNRRLYLWVYNPDGSSYIDKISGEIYENSIPAFSSDGSKVAFFEGDKSKSSLKLKVLNANFPDIVLFEKSYTNVSIETALGYEPNWTDGSNKIAFVFSESGKQKLILNSLEGTESVIEFNDISIVAGAVSPNADFFVFSDLSGDIKIMYIGNGENNISSISEAVPKASNIFYNWNFGSNKIVLNKYYQDDGFGNLSTLFLLDLVLREDKVEVSKEIVISNNAYKGFWGRKQK